MEAVGLGAGDVPGWDGYPTRKYRYTLTDRDGTKRTADVVMINPSAEKLAAWILSASHSIKGRNDPGFCGKLFKHVIDCSGGQFVVRGICLEDMDRDGIHKAYPFQDGVTVRLRQINGFPERPLTTDELQAALQSTPADKTATDTMTLTITAPLDANNNGLPDRWEDTQPPLTGGANDDDDGDGTTNHHEYQSGTNPAHPASVFKLVSYNLAPAQATLRFRRGTGRNYQLQRSTNLSTWLPVPGHETIPGTGGEIEVTTPAQTGFYRIAVKQDF